MDTSPHKVVKTERGRARLAELQAKSGSTPTHRHSFLSTLHFASASPPHVVSRHRSRAGAGKALGRGSDAFGTHPKLKKAIRAPCHNRGLLGPLPSK